MLSELIGELRSGLDRMRHRPFLEASMAAAALVAVADGHVSLSERSRLDDILEGLDLLKLYDVHDAVDLFNSHVAAMEEDRDRGRETALEQVALVADDATEADLVVRIGVAVGLADAEFGDDERKAIAWICKALGLNPGDYHQENRA